MMVNSNTERTPLTIDYGPGTIAYKRGQILLAQERLEAMRIRITNISAWIAFGFAVLCIVMVSALPAQATPDGYADFCGQHPANCAPVDPVFAEYDDLYATLVIEQHNIKFDIRFAPDKTDTWQYPVHQKGDSEDIAVYLRTRLEYLGVPFGAMRFATGIDQWNQDHIWLVVMTNQGAYALDVQELNPVDRFHARATELESYDCTEGQGCQWRSNILYPTEHPSTAEMGQD